MNYKEHKLKCWPGYFAAVKAGKKVFEARKNDRDFAPGDVVILQEWNPFDQKYSGDECSFRIGYILENYDAIIPGYCVFSLLPVEEKEAPIVAWEKTNDITEDRQIVTESYPLNTNEEKEVDPVKLLQWMDCSCTNRKPIADYSETCDPGTMFVIEQSGSKYMGNNCVQKTYAEIIEIYKQSLSANKEGRNNE